MRTSEPCLCGDPACKSCFPGGFDPPDAVINAVEALIDASEVTHYDRTADESLTECLACGQWESHTDECFMPALKRWQNGDHEVSAVLRRQKVDRDTNFGGKGGAA